MLSGNKMTKSKLGYHGSGLAINRILRVAVKRGISQTLIIHNLGPRHLATNN